MPALGADEALQTRDVWSRLRIMSLRAQREAERDRMRVTVHAQTRDEAWARRMRAHNQALIRIDERLSEVLRGGAA